MVHDSFSIGYMTWARVLPARRDHLTCYSRLEASARHHSLGPGPGPNESLSAASLSHCASPPPLSKRFCAAVCRPLSPLPANDTLPLRRPASSRTLPHSHTDSGLHKRFVSKPRVHPPPRQPALAHSFLERGVSHYLARTLVALLGVHPCQSFSQLASGTSVKSHEPDSRDQ